MLLLKHNECTVDMMKKLLRMANDPGKPLGGAGLFNLINLDSVMSIMNKNSAKNNSCSFPPKPLGGSFKVLKLMPRKTVKYFCHNGYHLW